jgi:hypothetical protein
MTRLRYGNVTIRAAIVSGVFMVAAAVVTGLFQYYGTQPKAGRRETAFRGGVEYEGGWGNWIAHRRIR